MSVTLLHQDCMEYMAGLPDGAFELAIVDPPYGIGRDGGETGKNWKQHEKKGWDSDRPTAEYFEELLRVSCDQIIFGANYFTQFIPASMGWVLWDKGQRLTMSDGELIFTSFERALRIFTLNRCFIGQGAENIHPTQKPVALYRWLLHHYAKPGWRILDTHLGSGSSAIAAHEMGFEFVGLEIDADYIAAARKRFDMMTRQTKLDL